MPYHTTLDGRILSSRTRLQAHALSIVTLLSFITTPSGNDELRHRKLLSMMCHCLEAVFGAV